jgi:hypothetical protein
MDTANYTCVFFWVKYISDKNTRLQSKFHNMQHCDSKLDQMRNKEVPITPCFAAD